MDVVDSHRSYAPPVLDFVVLTASDSRTETDDHSGQAVAELVENASYRVLARRVLIDDAITIRTAVEGILAVDEVDVVVLTGGTGFSPRDVSIEAVVPLFQRRIDGFGELFRMLSYEEIGAAAMLSRAVAGVHETTAIFVLPGSPKAVRLAMERLILPEAAHLVGQLRRSGRPS